MATPPNDTFVQISKADQVYTIMTEIGPVAGFMEVPLNNAVMLFVGMIGVTLLLRIMLANLPKRIFVNQYINEYIIVIVVGCILGGIFRAVGYIPFMNEVFLMVMISIILFDDGFCLENTFSIRRNFSRMILFGFGATLINVFGIGLILWAISSLFLISYSLVDLLMFASLISVLDPLSVLSVMMRKGGIEDLCVSEALVNPIVSISLFLLFDSLRSYSANVSLYLPDKC